MKKTLRRSLLVTAVTAAFAISMSTAAFAAELDAGVSETEDLTLNINKNITVTNPDLDSVDGPGMSYSYVIDPETPSEANGGTSVTDSENHTGNVHIGPADGVTLTVSSVSWPVGIAVNASSAGADNIKNITSSTDLSKFTAPGIYRYRITETPEPADPSSVGVTDNGDRVRYLDVYIVNGASGLEVEGYVLHDGSNNKKTFDTASYNTKNILLEKEVTGNMGDKNNQFPFSGTVNDNGRYFYARKAAAPTADDEYKIAGSRSGSSVSTTLAHTEKYYISGLSDIASVTYTETNNTPYTYAVSVTGGTASEATQVTSGETKSMEETAVREAEEVKFINDFESVTPTGVVSRYGLGAMAVAAAFILFVLGRKKSSYAN